jgi:uncharacterized protein YegP (UPF0339 family)
MANGKKVVIVSAYRDRSGGWRWGMKASNGAVVAASTESFGKRKRALENLHLVTGIRWRLPPLEKGPHVLRLTLPRGAY